MNGYYQEGVYQPCPSIHLGVAINLRSAGLITPALLNAEQLDLANLMDKLQDLTRRARLGGLRSSEMTSGTITITALGERGVDSVYGVIYPPQVAILGFGKVSPRPWAVGDALTVRPVMQATLAADHRVSDGHRGGLFLGRIDQNLQHPEQLNVPAQKDTA
jgi:pyruvate dehydrogenase E2 component (dihydrolipoamide acetyltransferase)